MTDTKLTETEKALYEELEDSGYFGHHLTLKEWAKVSSWHNVGALKRHFLSLTKKGLLESTRLGKQTAYRIVLSEMQAIESTMVDYKTLTHRALYACLEDCVVIGRVQEGILIDLTELSDSMELWLLRPLVHRNVAYNSGEETEGDNDLMRHAARNLINECLTELVRCKALLKGGKVKKYLDSHGKTAHRNKTYGALNVEHLNQLASKEATDYLSTCAKAKAQAVKAPRGHSLYFELPRCGLENARIYEILAAARRLAAH